MTKKTASFDTLSAVVGSLKGTSVLVAGDIMLDRFVYGEATRLSPESPVPVLAIKNEDYMPGGAGNVISNLHGLGVSIHVLGVTGNDEAGKILRGLVKDRGANPDGLIALDDRPTIQKTRFMAGSHHLLRADHERVAPVSAATEQEILKRAKSVIKNVGALVLSDYGKGVLTKVVIRGLIDIARDANVPVLVDPKGADFSIYKGSTVVTPNRKELSEATRGAATKTDDDVVAAAKRVIDDSGIESVVATRSEDGMSVIRKGQDALHLRAKALEVFDVSGAGDTVIACIAAALAAGADLADAAAIANIAGGIVVAKVGTTPVRLNEIESRLAGHEGGSNIAYDWNEAAETIRRWKAQGLKVGMTNGCFDIIHRGHVGYLAQARSRCDRLVMALNTDASIKRLKGPTRPVNNEEARAIVMAGLSSISLVVLFGGTPEEDDKPIRVIDALKPDIFFKGGDYTEDQLPEAKTVRAYGGEVSIMPLFEGHSTTSIIKR